MALARRVLVCLASLLVPAVAIAAEPPPPVSRSAECGILLPCVPAAPRGLAGHLRLGLLVEQPERAQGAPFALGGWISLGLSFWRWGEAGVFFAGTAESPLAPGDGVRWRSGPLGIWGVLAPPLLQHLGGSEGRGGLSVAFHGELDTGRAPFDGGGRLYDVTQSYGVVLPWEEWRLHGGLVAGVQLADDDRARCGQGCAPAYRGGYLGASLWARVTRTLYVGGDALIRVDGAGTRDAFAAVGFRLLEDAGIAGSAAGAWRADLRTGQTSWRYLVGFGVSYGPGYDSHWLREMLRLPDLRFSPRAVLPPPTLPTPPLAPPPPGPSCYLDPLGGPPLHLSSLDRAQDPVSSWRSFRSCQVAGWASETAQREPGVMLAQAGPYRPLPAAGPAFRPLPGWRPAAGPRWPEAEPREEAAPERAEPAPGQPGFRGWRAGQPVPPWWWRLPVPLTSSIGPAPDAPSPSPPEAPAAPRPAAAGPSPGDAPPAEPAPTASEPAPAAPRAPRRQRQEFKRNDKRAASAENRERYGTERCESCGIEVQAPPPGGQGPGERVPPNQRTYDHILPDLHGGPPTRSNIDILCSECNLAKGSDYWVPWLRNVIPPTPRLK